ncbi:MAG: hypothetical protein JXB39_09325 [Deltaproteobacteria bacterium]|nr:hypothetical protein [Deltaproteobacteria bacterium]
MSPPSPNRTRRWPIPGALPLSVCLASGSLVLYELLLTRLFAVVLFAQFAHLALGLALLGISVGAVAQHLWPRLVPEDGLERRVALLCLALAGAVLCAVLAAIRFPVIEAPSGLPATYQARSIAPVQLLDPGWFAALLPLLAFPFVLGGALVSGILQRRKGRISGLYAADLLGGAAGALVFVPLLGALAGPDTAFAVVAAASLAAVAAARGARWRAGALVAGIVFVTSTGAGLVGRASGELLHIRESAGFSEKGVQEVRWTALTRLSLYEGSGRTLVLLDNSSASEVVTTRAQREAIAQSDSRGLVYRLHDPSSRVAILAASAGPEIAAAQHWGFRDIDAIDIASEIYDLVDRRFAHVDVNPFRHPGVRRVHADGRAAILTAREPYTIIQMVHANLWSAAGLLAVTWSPSLLETREAFGTYLDHLVPDGTLAFARGQQTGSLVPPAVSALRARGVMPAWRALALVDGDHPVLLVKKRPWTEAERARLALEMSPRSWLAIDPVADDLSLQGRKMLFHHAILTDDRPYLDRPSLVWNALVGLGHAGGLESVLGSLYQCLVVQALFVLGAGIAFLLVPWMTRGRSEMAAVRGWGGLLGFVAGLGYGYLAIETVLVHDLILFVGHPTYAVTVVVFALLLASGLGSLATGRLSPERGARLLRPVLVGVMGLGLLQAWVAPPVLHATCLGLPISARVVLTAGLLVPLGFLMGMPFPLALRALPPGTSGVVPWAWALNGWMSVVATLSTVLLSRLSGYRTAFAVALGAYLLAFLLVGTLSRVRTGTAEG